MNVNELSLSIIIPYYNDVKHKINENLQLFSACIFNYEVIIIDDGSTEEVKINNYKNVRIIKKINQGVSSARNTGIINAKGKYLFFLDSDDLVPPRFIAFLNTNLYKLDYDWVFFDTILKLEGKEIYIKTIDSNEINTQNLYVKLLMTGNLNECWGKLIKKNFVLANNIKFDERTNQGEDFIFNVDLLLKKCDWHYAGMASYIYIRYPTNYDKRFLRDVPLGFRSLKLWYDAQNQLLNLLDNEIMRVEAAKMTNAGIINSLSAKLMILLAENKFLEYKDIFYDNLSFYNVKRLTYKMTKFIKCKIYLFLFKHNMIKTFKILGKIRKKRLNKKYR